MNRWSLDLCRRGQRLAVRPSHWLPAFLLLALAGVTRASSPAADPVYAFRHLGVDNGLSQSHVTTITQDRLGFIWVGTAVGLNRYDGRTFTTYRHSAEDPESLSGNGIYSLLHDRKGRLWVGTEAGLDQFLPESGRFRRHKGVAMAGRARVRALDSDAAGSVWAALAGGRRGDAWLLTRFNPDSGELRRYEPPRNVGGGVVAVCAIEGKVLVLVRNPGEQNPSRGFGLFLLDAGNGEWKELDGSSIPALPAGYDSRDLSLVKGSAESAWVGAPGDRVFKVDLASRRVDAVDYSAGNPAPQLKGLVSHVVAGPEGQVWVLPTSSSLGRKATSNAIYSLSANGGAVGRSVLRPHEACDLGRNFVISSHIDQTGVLWAGLSGAGMCAADLRSGMFNRLHEDHPITPLDNNFVRTTAKGPDGLLYVGTRVGLNIIDRARGTVRSIRANRSDPGSLADDDVTALLLDQKGRLWAGTQKGGLHRSANGARSFIRYQPGGAAQGALSSEFVSSLLEDSKSTIWVATHLGGLNRFDEATGTFASYRRNPNDREAICGNFINGMVEDSRGQFWIATEDGGLCQLDRASGRFTSALKVNAVSTYLLSVTEDPRQPGVLWLGTLRDGIARYDSRSDEVAWFTPSNSTLPSATVYSLVSDGRDSVWAGTNRGLVRIEARTQAMRIFGIDQGLQSMEFNTRAASRAADGEMLMGGVGGLNAFYPENITQNSSPGKLWVTSVRTLNRGRDAAINPYREFFRAGQAPDAAHLDSGNRDIIFEFVLLHFADPARNSYRVRLDGFDSDWRDTGTNNQITYTNLGPGTYRFRVRAVTSRGVWSEGEATYAFTIDRPLHQQPWFLFLVAVAAIASAFSLHRLRLRNLRIAKVRLETEVAMRTGELSDAMAVIESQTAKLRESDALKSRFMTNVSHDFRTPITITMGVLNDIRNGVYGPVDPRVSSELDLALRNERRMLRLVQQLTDIARLDGGKLRLRVSETDLAALVQEVVVAFQPLARQHRLSLRFETGEPATAWCDDDWISQVIANLLLNGIRFTPAGGEVVVEAGHDPASGRNFVAIRDSGAGIPPAALPHIFERFYQAEPEAPAWQSGLGVGLSLVREIVGLHGAEIQVESTPGAGTRFRVLFEAGFEHFDAAQLSPAAGDADGSMDLDLLVSDLVEESSSAGTEDAEPSDGPLVVVAEDNGDLRNYLLRHLQSSYRVLAAGNGLDALALVRREVPDLVLADIAMPGLDGVALCRELRQSPETNFIPVILLTARASAEAVVTGLDAGADDYITKPFEMPELQGRIRNLLEARMRFRTHVAASLSLERAVAQDPVPVSADAAFLERVYGVIRLHAPDPEFSVDRLAEELNMSRMHLYRRLKELLARTPADVLMDYRLERAAELLAARTGTVSEVAYGLGFKSLSHFTRRFRERFGATPSEHRAKTEQSAAERT